MGFLDCYPLWHCQSLRSPVPTYHSNYATRTTSSQWNPRVSSPDIILLWGRNMKTRQASGTHARAPTDSLSLQSWPLTFSTAKYSHTGYLKVIYRVWWPNFNTFWLIVQKHRQTQYPHSILQLWGSADRLLPTELRYFNSDIHCWLILNNTWISLLRFRPMRRNWKVASHVTLPCVDKQLMAANIRCENVMTTDLYLFIGLWSWRGDVQ